MRFGFALVAAFVVVVQGSNVYGLDPYLGNDPYWILLHEPVVVQELQLSDTQRAKYRGLTDKLDQEFFPLRNKPSADAAQQMQEIVGRAKVELQTLLTQKQRDRIEQILFRKLAAEALLTEKFIAKMRYTAEQQEKIEQILKETTGAVAALRDKAAAGEPQSQLDDAFRKLKEQEREQLLELLTESQVTTWTKLLGANFSVAKLGKPAIRVPELVDSGEWINSKPMTLEELRGKVVIVHFYACNCINCIHNFPIYLKWHEDYAGKDVVLVGIQTPEVKSERDPAHVRKKAAEAKLPFPILIDLKSENWNAWGNSMWPSVYLVDKQGYLRDFWAGELQWQGATGDQYLQSRVEELLAGEKTDPLE